MRSQNPRSPGSRRRIAGERRPVRPEEPGTATDPTTDPTTDPATERTEAGERTPSAAPAPVATPRRPRRTPRADRPRGAGAGPSWVVVAVVGAVALVLVVVAAVLGLGVWNVGKVNDQTQVDEATRAAPSAAERAASSILSYGYQSLDADEKAAERYMTPAYKKKYAATFDKLVRPNAAKVRAKVDAEVKASGVSHADPDRVNVLVYVNQTTTSTANGGEPQQALNRVMFSMKRDGGSWRVDNITSY
jgi:Mce-associated membrane protein